MKALQAILEHNEKMYAGDPPYPIALLKQARAELESLRWHDIQSDIPSFCGSEYQILCWNGFEFYTITIDSHHRVIDSIQLDELTHWRPLPEPPEDTQ